MDMSDPKDCNHELDKRLAVLEERMNTIQANLDATLKTIQANLDATLNAFRADAEKRDKTLLITLGGLIIGVVAIGVTVLGVWLG
ncbi:MAG: hypothetical protein OXD29_06665 [Roseovarius sp.]|nr:hypothetical protein [Roseovarius sp.]